MSNQPLVSIIIPTFNRAHLIGETLDSVLAQTYTHWECIVVDDGSTDNTEEVVLKYVRQDKRFQFYKRPDDRTKGGNAARNYGFEKSKGELIQWFDSDDLMIAEKLEKQVVFLLKNSCFEFVVCQSLVFEQNRTNILGLRNNKIHSEDFFNDFIQNNIKFLTQSPLFRRSFLAKNNIKFDEELKQYQEREYFLRVFSFVNDYGFLEEPLVLLRKHLESISYGVYSIEKNSSRLYVESKILSGFYGSPSVDSKRFLTKQVKSHLRDMIKEGYKREALKEIIKLKKKNLISLKEFRELILGIFIFTVFKKGEKFFK